MGAGSIFFSFCTCSYECSFGHKEYIGSLKVLFLSCFFYFRYADTIVRELRAPPSCFTMEAYDRFRFFLKMHRVNSFFFARVS